MDRTNGPHDRLTSEPTAAESLDLSSHTDGDTVVITIAGELDLDGIARFEQAVLDALATGGIASLHLDLAGLRFIDSSGLQGILRVKQSGRKAGIEVRVLAVTPFVQRVIDMAGLDDVLGTEPLGSDGDA
jgi:anti-sigma B factor antagonist